ncbi:MAG: MBL fold metallo-hydrolase, partial [Lentisphaeraceae bacterium]|nr:MBL fold metallo-hydrolase [Lentisphaeraceae bacterium]
MKLFFCGGAGEVGASCILLELCGKRILLDCGMRMKGDALPDLLTVQENGGVDAIVLSHAHMDHSGNLPLISREYPQAKIYMTPPTQDLIRLLLYDGLKIMEQEAEIPVFDKKHVEFMLAQVTAFGYMTPWTLFEDEEIQLTFYPAGHILGAASVHINSPQGSLLYSGDISVTPQRSVGACYLEKLRPAALILESTYGNRLH